MREMNPWAGEAEFVAIYGDGRVLFHHEGEHAVPYLLSKLGPDELGQLLRSLPIGQLGRLDESVSTTEDTDQSITQFVVWDERGRKKQVAVYGSIESPRAPQPTREAFVRLRAYADARAAPWLPPQVLGSICHDSLSTDWPDDLPRPNLSSRKDRRAVYFRVPAAKFASLQAYLARHVGSCVSYVIRLPHDELWKSPNERGMGKLDLGDQ